MLPSDAVPDDRTTAGQPLDDPERLRVLRETGLLDSDPEESFDRLTRLASVMLDAPVAQVALVETDRQFFKSRVVLDRDDTSRETGLDRSFCQFLVTDGADLVVSDAREHPKLRGNPAIEDGVIAYCGQPLRLRDGHILGSLCVVDRVPRDWTTYDADRLRDLAAMVVTEIELRLAIRAADQRAHALLDAARGVRTLDAGLSEMAAEGRRSQAAAAGLAARLAHELRTPLAAIRGLVELMLDEDPRSWPTDLRTIDRSAAEALHLINEQLVATRLHSGQTRVRADVVDVVELMSALRGMMLPLRPSDAVDLIVEAPADFPPMVSDAGKVAQILRNLVANALQATTRGTVTVVPRLEGEFVAFDVTDTGTGVPAEQLGRIFAEHVRLEEGSEHAGAGLGLPIARRLAGLLGGDVTATSVMGRGSTFTLRVRRELDRPPADAHDVSRAARS